MLLIQNANIKPIVGEDIPNGCILVADGKIAAIGEHIDVPADCQVLDAAGHLVTPGLVEGHCHTGMTNDRGDAGGKDHNEKSDPIVPQMRALDGFNPMEEGVTRAPAGGVTTICTGPGSAEVIGGTFIATKTAGKRIDDMVIDPAMAMKCAFGENPKRVFGDKGKMPVTRMAIAALMRETLFKTKEYLDAKQSGKAPKFDMKLEAMIPVIQGKMPLKVHAHRADDIFTAIRIAKEFDLKLTLDHCTDGSLIAEELGKEGYPVFVGPCFGGRKSKAELDHKTYANAAALQQAGLTVSIISDAPVLPLEHLAFYAGMAHCAGLSYENTWRAITINPAVANGLDKRVGSLEVGKDADIVIWSDDPITTVGAHALTTLIDGNIVYSV